jgi:hypothetical protein
MAAISHIITIRRVAQMLGRDEDLPWDLADYVKSEEGKIWIHDINEIDTLAFSQLGIETLREIIADRIDRTR